MGNLSEFVASFLSFMKSYFLCLKMFRLDCLSEDLPAVLGQDDLGLGCPLLHIVKVSRVTESAQSPLSPPAQKEF